ncbi:ABC transporter substrate-binding protein [Actinoplanes sp. CA-015351]|uniref:ABC transporter substrate-binding protein n=1 Tax=Actinoplanes sp. CA-015351 TaxID=3239897 RepID=UPI003D98A7DC
MRRTRLAADEALITGNPSLSLQRGLNSGSAYSYHLNVSHAPFDDLQVRQAFREAVDVDAVLTGVYRGTATRAWSVVGPTSPFYDKTLEGTFGGDPTKADQLLDEAGWTTRDAEGHRTKAGKRLTSRADTDAGAALNLLLHAAGAINQTGFTDAALDGLLDDAQASTGTAARTEAYRQVQKLVVTDQALVLPLYAPADQIAAGIVVLWTFGVLIGGSVIIEQVFGRPGLGQVALQAVSAGDMPVVIAVVVLAATVFVVVNTLADLAGLLIDPRLRRS